MSTTADSARIDDLVAPQPASRWWAVVDGAMNWAGDRLNPILVKETRQALKSKQFTITFGLLLICGWVWSIVGVAWVGPNIWYTANGPTMFIGYYIILAFPLMVIVPFSAFRSIAGEQEDRTYELMSITALGPRQIVRGKLGSAVLQMLIYLSAISPCLAFTYMLRGIDFPTILFVLFYVVLGSLALSVVGLLLGTLTAEKHWQVVLSVLLIAGLLYANGCAIGLGIAMITEGRSVFTEPVFWQVNAAVVTAYVSYFVLLFYAAAAQLTFESDNRSTRLRATMLVQHALFTGWMAWVWISPLEGEPAMLIIYMIFIGLHWWAMGTFLTGESPELSPRVKRALPQSFLGRVFLTWFNPGPGTGYMLSIGSLSAVLVTVLIAVAAANAFDSPNLSEWEPSQSVQLLAFGLLGLSYVAAYLGIGLLMIRFLRKFTYVGVLMSVLIQILLVLMGVLVPLVIQGVSFSMRNSGYTLMQISNPVWTLIEMGEGRNLPADAPVLLLIVGAVALIVFLLNLSAVAREVRRVRIAKPRRVAEEDAQLEAIKHPPQPVRTSPWD